jgi:hypothetical protein
MGTNALAADAVAGALPEAWLAADAKAELAGRAAGLLFDPELVQAASRPAAAMSTAVRASFPGSIRPMPFAPSPCPHLVRSDASGAGGHRGLSDTMSISECGLVPGFGILPP